MLCDLLTTGRLCFFFATALLQSFLSVGQVAQDSVAERDEAINFLQQTKKGTWVLGSNFGVGLGFRNEDLGINNSIALIDFTVLPRLSFFPANRLAIGLNFHVFGSLASFNDARDYGLVTRNILFSTRYYIKGGFFGELGYGTGIGVEQFRENQERIRNTFDTRQVAVALGLGNFWLEKFNFELMLRYNSTWNNFGGSANLFNGLAMTAGVNYTFIKKNR